MNDRKTRRLICVLCWLGVAMAGFLTGFMIHLARQFPEVEAFSKNVYLAGALALLWLAVAVYFTLCERRHKGK